MIDVGFSELVVIAIVALVVIGPERLPKVARTFGHLFGRMQRYVDGVKADINREIHLDELKKLQADFQDSARGFEMNILGEMQAVKQKLVQQAPLIEPIVQEFSATPVKFADKL
jgi:sec-independent protein translocase protein TatB